jgi:hypothetical protein
MRRYRNKTTTATTPTTTTTTTTRRKRRTKNVRVVRRLRTRMIFKGGAFTFESIGTLTHRGKRLIVSFDNDELSDKNIKIYIRESQTDPTRRDMSNLHLDHKYLNVPISACSNKDIIRIKFLYTKWLLSLDDAAKAKLPDFVWADHFNERWTEVDAAEKKPELTHLQQKLVAANYEELYTQLLKYDDPFGASFDTAAPQPRVHSSATATSKTAKVNKLDKETLSTLRKMELANEDLESNQRRLQSRRVPKPKPFFSRFFSSFKSKSS